MSSLEAAIAESHASVERFVKQLGCISQVHRLGQEPKGCNDDTLAR